MIGRTFNPPRGCPTRLHGSKVQLGPCRCSLQAQWESNCRAIGQPTAQRSSRLQPHATCDDNLPRDDQMPPWSVRDLTLQARSSVHCEPWDRPSGGISQRLVQPGDLPLGHSRLPLQGALRQSPAVKVTEVYGKRMQHATFRFYAELNEFLPEGLRHTRITHHFEESASIKQMIESLGISHAEIDLILINGDSVDFTYLVQDRDRVTVYPVFETFDISTAVRVRPQPFTLRARRPSRPACVVPAAPWLRRDFRPRLERRGACDDLTGRKPHSPGA